MQSAWQNGPKEIQVSSYIHLVTTANHSINNVTFKYNSQLPHKQSLTLNITEWFSPSLGQNT